MGRSPYLLGIVIATVLAWISWVLVLSKLSPFKEGMMALGFFYSSLTVALAGTFALLLYFFRAWRTTEPIGYSELSTALRQGVLLGLMISIALIFQRLRVLTWWDALLLLVIVFLIEFYFLSRD